MFAATQAVALCLLCALAMGYGWGWRESYGHEAGAMLPGALVGMAVCLASGRPDWYRRTAIAGLCGAVGWSWGGGLSNMDDDLDAALGRAQELRDVPRDRRGLRCV